MFNFSFQNTTTIHFGKNQIAQITGEIPLSANILLVYGSGSIKTNGVFEQVVSALEKHHFSEFSGIKPNPQYAQLMQAVTLVKEQNINFILAVGGGSVIDGCKFIAAAACYAGDDPWDILLEQKKVTDALPIGVVLTLPATGSESNSGSVVTRDSNKLSFLSPKIRPQFAILDPQVTRSLSARQIGNGVVDAFVHILEQYLTYPVDAKVQDRFAEGLLLTLIEEGPKILTDENCLPARANVMWAASQALNGLIGAGVPQDWSTHMIGHELTGLYGIDHARSLSIILPAVLKEMSTQKSDKLLQYAERVWGIKQGNKASIISTVINRTEKFFQLFNLPINFSDADLDESNIPQIIEKLKQHGMTKLGENRNIDLTTVESILNRAL